MDKQKMIELIKRAKSYQREGYEEKIVDNLLNQVLAELENQPELISERAVEEFINSLQWDLRSSYNSSSCLNSKQREMLKKALLYDFIIDRQDKREKKQAEEIKQKETKIKEQRHTITALDISFHNWQPEGWKEYHRLKQQIRQLETENQRLVNQFGEEKTERTQK